jgi:hypothetical protein
MARVTRRRSRRRGLRVVAKGNFKGSLSAMNVSLWSCAVKSGGGGHAVLLLLLEGRRRWVLNTVDSLSPTVHIPSNRDTGTAWQWQWRWQCTFALNRTKRRDGEGRNIPIRHNTQHNTGRRTSAITKLP